MNPTKDHSPSGTGGEDRHRGTSADLTTHDSSDKPIRIVAAAILWNGTVYTGDRHGHIIRQIVIVNKLTEKYMPINGEQGFIDQNNRFYTRDEAKEIVLNNGQLEKLNRGDTLYSEDLW